MKLIQLRRYARVSLTFSQEDNRQLYHHRDGRNEESEGQKYGQPYLGVEQEKREGEGGRNVAIEGG